MKSLKRIFSHLFARDLSAAKKGSLSEILSADSESHSETPVVTDVAPMR